MDDQEMEEILYRLDERTKRVDEHLNRLDNIAKNNKKQIGEIRTRTDRNTRDISYGKAILGATVTVVTGLMARVAGWLHV